MLDIKFIRENAEAVKKNCENRNVKCDVDRLLELDKSRVSQLQYVEELQAEKNKLNQLLPTAQGDEKTALFEQAKGVKEKLATAQPELEKSKEEFQQILLSVLSHQGLQPKLYPPTKQGDLALLDDQERLATALDWARRQKLDYVISGSVEEWQYKNGLDGEPAVGISLRVIEPASGRVIWSTSGARAG